MAKKSLLGYIKRLRRGVFTAHELCAVSGKSASTVIQSLNILKQEGIIFKVCRGIWAEAYNDKISAYTVIPFLLPRHRAYVSFVSALHLHGIIEQIPQVTTLATTAHTRTIHTQMGTYRFHQLHPALFNGFDWYKGIGSFLIAEPEKALIDSLYLSTRRKKQFGHFPELYFSDSFNFKKARKWVSRISEKRIRIHVEQRLKEIGMTASRKRH